MLLGTIWAMQQGASLQTKALIKSTMLEMPSSPHCSAGVWYLG